MYRTFGILENTWFKNTIRFPIKLGKSYLINKRYEGDEWFKEPIRKWEQNLNNSVGRYPYIIQVKNQRQIVDRSIYYGSLKNLALLIRFSSYNRTNLAHGIDFNNTKIQGWISYTDSSLPSYFRNGPEELN